MKHTKGPWHKGQGNGEGSIFADEGRMKWGENGTALYPICSMVTGFNAEEDEANANLIISAPDLLEALNLLLSATVDDDLAHGITLTEKEEEARAFALNAIAKATGHTYNAQRIAWELERTAMNDGFYGNALRVAKDLPCVTAEDRSLLDRYATGRQGPTDHIELQQLALRIDKGETK